MSHTLRFRMQLGSRDDLSVEGEESDNTKGYLSWCFDLHWASALVGIIDDVMVVICGTWGSSRSSWKIGTVSLCSPANK